MLRAFFFWRSINARAIRHVCVCALAIFLPATAASAYDIDLKLNVAYTDPENVLSGGTWELIGKSDPNTDFGIASLNVRLSNINTSAQFHGPRGTVNGSDNAGFWIQENSLQTGAPNSRRFTVGQALAFVPGPGEDGAYFFGVGTLENGAPAGAWPGKPSGTTGIGPAFTTLVPTRSIPWAPPETAEPDWETAVKFLSGTFPTGVTPEFFTGEATTGQVFGSLASNPADIFPANVTTEVDTTPPGFQLPDYNENGFVDAPDYVLWRKQDINGPQGYDDWAQYFGEVASGSGSLQGGAGAVSTPEPASVALVALAGLMLGARRNRKN